MSKTSQRTLAPPSAQKKIADKAKAKAKASAKYRKVNRGKK